MILIVTPADFVLSCWYFIPFSIFFPHSFSYPTLYFTFPVSLAYYGPRAAAAGGDPAVPLGVLEFDDTFRVETRPELTAFTCDLIFINARRWLYCQVPNDNLREAQEWATAVTRAADAYRARLRAHTDDGAGAAAPLRAGPALRISSTPVVAGGDSPGPGLAFGGGSGSGRARRRRATAAAGAVGGVDTLRFGAFTPPRAAAGARWFVDGRAYLAAVADALAEARHEILITDWHLSPELRLRRCGDARAAAAAGIGGGGKPGDAGDPGARYRLDRLLLAAAERGVNVFVLVWEVPLGMAGNDDAHVKTLLQGMHERIHVVRHPPAVSGAAVGTFITKGSIEDSIWSHHEKVAVVDRCVAFVGGIDLAFGRYDWHQHCVHAAAPPRWESHNGGAWDSSENAWAQPPMSYFNPEDKDFADVKHADTFTLADIYGPGDGSAEAAAAVAAAAGGRGSRASTAASTGVSARRTPSPAGRAAAAAADVPFVPPPRMPWHDVAVSVAGPAARGVALHFVQRWNHAVDEKKGGGNQYQRRKGGRAIVRLLPWSDAWSAKVPDNYQRYGADAAVPPALLPEGKRDPREAVEAQVLRSVGSWSAGRPTENSIHRAYCAAIESAERYLYLENQPVEFLQNTFSD